MIARLALALGLVTATTAAPARAQMPQRAQEIAILRELIADVESGRKIAATPQGTMGHMILVESDQLATIATYRAAQGMHPDSIPAWTRRQKELSGRILIQMKESLARLEQGGEWEPPAPPARPENRPQAGSVPGDVSWPVPMDWTRVSGTVRGTFTMLCWFDERRLPEIRGTFRVDLRGNGEVLGSYTEDRHVREANGRIDASGQASGNGRTANETILWNAQFTREGNRLVMGANTTLMMTPFESKARCERGVVYPE